MLRSVAYEKPRLLVCPELIAAPETATRAVVELNKSGRAPAYEKPQILETRPDVGTPTAIVPIIIIAVDIVVLVADVVTIIRAVRPGGASTVPRGPSLVTLPAVKRDGPGKHGLG